MKQRRSVLIVEDEMVIAMDLQSSLEGQGYKVTDHVTRGEDVIESIAVNKPDIILMDIKLDGDIDGVETAQMIYNDHEIPVIFLTSYSNKAIIERAKKTNPFGYIVKPFEERELFTNIELAIFKHESELKLRESEKKYRELSESIQQIIIEFDVLGNIIYLNESGMKMLGVTFPDIKGGISIVKFLGPEGFEQIKSRICRQNKDANDYPSRELVLTNSFGKHLFIEEYLSPVYVQSSVQGYRGILIDITSKKLKETLHGLFNKLTLLYDEFTVDPSEIIKFLVSELRKSFYFIDEVYFNANNISSMESSGMSDDDMRYRYSGSQYSEYVTGTKKPLYLRGRDLNNFNSLRAIETSGKRAVCWSGFPINFQNKNFGVFVFQSFKNENAMIPSDFDNLVYFFNNINALFERISYLRVIKKSEEKFKHLVSSINEGIIQLDLFANITYINNQFCDMLGYTKSELVGKNLFEAVRLSSENIEFLKQELAIRKRGVKNQYEIIVETKDSKQKSLLINSSPFMSVDGSIIGSLATIIDITEKKEFQKIIRENEQRFKAIFEQAAVGVAMVDTKSGKLLKVNKRYCEIMGYSYSELLEMNFMEFTHPDDLILDIRHMELLRQGDISEFSIEKRQFKKDGSEVWINLTVSPLWNKGDEPTNHIAIIENITHRKGIEAELKNSEQEKESILKSMPDSFLVLDKNYLILKSYCKCNDSIIKKIEVENIDGYNLKDVINSALYEGITLNISECMKSGKLILTEFDFEYEGKRNWYEIRYIQINQQFVLMIIRNVSDVQNNILELKKFYNITEQTNELIMITDKNGIIEYVNPTFSEVTGYQFDEIKGKTPAVFKSDKHPETFYKELWATILKGKIYSGHIVNVKKSSDLYIEEKLISPLLDDKGEITHFISTGRDVTEEIKRERKIKTYEKFEKILEKKEQKYRTYALIQGQENERKRIARELHDGLGQLLTVASANLESIDTGKITSKEDRSKLDVVNQIVSEIIQESRRISHNLSPVGLYEFGLEAVLKQFVNRISTNFKNLAINLKSNLNSVRFTNDIEINLYRIIQESIQNSLKHSNADKIDIIITYKDYLLKVIIKDNGVGFDYKQISDLSGVRHINGIRNIEERAKIIDAKLTLKSQINKGCSLELLLRVKKIKDDKNILS